MVREEVKLGQILAYLLTGHFLKGDSGGVCSAIEYSGDTTGSGSSYAAC